MRSGGTCCSPPTAISSTSLTSCSWDNDCASPRWPTRDPAPGALVARSTSTTMVMGCMRPPWTSGTGAGVLSVDVEVEPLRTDPEQRPARRHRDGLHESADDDE